MIKNIMKLTYNPCISEKSIRIHFKFLLTDYFCFNISVLLILNFVLQPKFTLWDGKPLTGHLCCGG